MKKSPLRRRVGLKPAKGLKSGSKLAARCECGHSKKWHKDTGLLRCTYSVLCPCGGYCPRRSLAQGQPLKSRKLDPAKRRGAKRKNEAYRAFIRTQPCAISGARSHDCYGPVQQTHIKSFGSGGADESNLLPLCAMAHQHQHNTGLHSWAAGFGLTVDDLKQLAADYWTKYDALRGIRL